MYSVHGEAGLGAEDQGAVGWNGAGPHGLGGRQWCLQWEFTRGVALVIFRYLSGKRNKRKADQPELQQ